MTDGHKHRTVPVRKDGLVHRLLSTRVLVTNDFNRVDESPYPYGPCEPEKGLDSEFWYLSVLSIAHRWTGLTLEVQQPDGRT